MKGKGKVLPECTRYTDYGLECTLRPGRSTSCMPCRDVKLKCEWPRVEMKEV